jgi:hypothetical protein
MKRWDIINKIIKKFNYNSYLEIGTQDPTCNFDKIDALIKVSIDPFPRGLVTFTGTSDEYFKSITDNIKFDIIFIDGLHHNDQVLKDIENSLKHLNENGTIVCHDCLPTTRKMQERNDHGEEWTGDVWKAVAKLRKERTDLDIKVVDTDYGCGIIRRGINQPYEAIDEDYLTYDHFEFFKYDMMNVITINQFLEWTNLQ